jgi:DNA-directed RNA polymerase subunit K/omega
MTSEDLQDVAGAPETAAPAPVLSEPITNRFLFVDVASMRAKQLRRGALPRLGVEHEVTMHRPEPPVKPERVAMEEVRRGLVGFEVPEWKGRTA